MIMNNLKVYKFRNNRLPNYKFLTWLLKKDENGLINGLAPGVTNRTLVTKCTNEWHRIDWKIAGAEIKDLQEKIVKATIQKKMKEAYRLQAILVQKHSASAIAVRKVITNKGGKTAGVDGIVWNSPKQYWQGVSELREILQNNNLYEASPVKRVYIPKGNGEQRPLGIPTMIDRAIQAVYHLAVDPVVETLSEPNSFGFRKRRSTHDAVTVLRGHLYKPYSPRWVLEADIAKCFDRISHEFLLRHTPIIYKRPLEQWLQAGIMEEMNYYETEEGTPQGGIFSPLLCNVALNGVEKIIRELHPPRRGISAGVHLIRYADDIVVTGKNQDVLLDCKEAISKFLVERGLELSDRKTKITHINKGFDFLGFNFRRMERNLHYNQNGSQGSVLIVKPNHKGKEKLTAKVLNIINPNRPFERIISDINPVLRGWGEHKRISYHSQATFIKLDHWIFWKMTRWVAKRRGSVKGLFEKYIISTEARKWNWGLSETKKILNLAEIPIIQLRPLALERNPYLSKDEGYFNKRIERLTTAKFRAVAYMKCKHICSVCGESLHNGEPVELHHVTPQKTGGKYSLKNIQPLHQICHQKVTYSR